MTTMTYVIIALLVGIIVFTTKSNNLKNKSYKTRTAGEDIIKSLTTKFNSSLKKLSDGVRNPKVIKEELSMLISEIEANLDLNFKESLLELRLTEQELKDSLITLDSLRNNNKNKASDFYRKYKENDTKSDLQLSKQLMSQIKSLGENEIKIKNKLEEIKKLENEFEFNYNMNKIKLQDKKLDIVTVTTHTEPQFEFLQLDDLTSEYKTKVNRINVEHEVEKKVRNITEDDHKYSDKELLEDLESLLN